MPAKEFEQLSLFPRASIQALGSSLQDQNLSLLWVVNPQERKEKPHFFQYRSSSLNIPSSRVGLRWGGVVTGEGQRNEENRGGSGQGVEEGNPC